jgi:hypothetical protein
MSPKSIDKKSSKTTQGHRNDLFSSKEKAVRPSPLGQPSTKVLLLLLLNKCSILTIEIGWLAIEFEEVHASFDSMGMLALVPSHTD